MVLPIVRSVFPRKPIAFDVMFYIFYMIFVELSYLQPTLTIRLWSCTDSKSLFHHISDFAKTSERRFILDISGTLDSLERHKISDIYFVLAGSSISDLVINLIIHEKLRKAISVYLKVEPSTELVGRIHHPHIICFCLLNKVYRCLLFLSNSLSVKLTLCIMSFFSWSDFYPFQ